MIQIGPLFYFTRSSVNAAPDPEAVLLYRMDMWGNFTPLDLRKSDLGVDLLSVPENAGAVRLAQIEERDGAF